MGRDMGPDESVLLLGAIAIYWSAVFAVAGQSSFQIVGRVWLPPDTFLNWAYDGIKRPKGLQFCAD